MKSEHLLYDMGATSAVTRGHIQGECTEAGSPPYNHWGPIGPFQCPYPH